MKIQEHSFITMELIDQKKKVDRVAYDQVYRFWQTEWSKAICELGLTGLSVNISDKFLSADEILVLRDDRNIAAVALINHLDLNFAAYKDISYLKAMPDEGMTFILNNGFKKIMTSGYNIVTKRYRRVAIKGILLSLVLPGAAIALFEMRPEFDLVMGMPLIPSGNHRTLTRLGMRDIPGGNITIHDVQAKFMYITRDVIDFGQYDAGIRSLFHHHALSVPS